MLAHLFSIPCRNPLPTPRWRPYWGSLKKKLPDWSARQLAGYSLERAAHPDGEAPDQPPMDEEIAVETAATAVVASALLGLPDVVQRR